MKRSTKIKRKWKKVKEDILWELGSYGDTIKSVFIFFKNKKNSIKDRLLKLFKNKEFKKRFFLFGQFFSMVFFYGLLTNLMLYGIWEYKITLYSLISLGILVYFVKEEFPEWVNKVMAWASRRR